MSRYEEGIFVPRVGDKVMVTNEDMKARTLEKMVETGERIETLASLGYETQDYLESLKRCE